MALGILTAITECLKPRWKYNPEENNHSQCFCSKSNSSTIFSLLSPQGPFLDLPCCTPVILLRVSLTLCLLLASRHSALLLSLWLFASFTCIFILVTWKLIFPQILSLASSSSKCSLGYRIHSHMLPEAHEALSWAGKWKCHSFSRVQLLVIPWTVACQAPCPERETHTNVKSPLGCSTNTSIYMCSKLNSSFPGPEPAPHSASANDKVKWKWSRSVVSDSLRPHGL